MKCGTEVNWVVCECVIDLCPHYMTLAMTRDLSFYGLLGLDFRLDPTSTDSQYR